MAGNKAPVIDLTDGHDTPEPAPLPKSTFKTEVEKNGANIPLQRAPTWGGPVLGGSNMMRPEALAYLPMPSQWMRAEYTGTLTRLWMQLSLHPPSSQTHHEIVLRIRSVSDEVIRTIVANWRPLNWGGHEAPGQGQQMSHQVPPPGHNTFPSMPPPAWRPGAPQLLEKPLVGSGLGDPFFRALRPASPVAPPVSLFTPDKAQGQILEATKRKRGTLPTDEQQKTTTRKPSAGHTRDAAPLSHGATWTKAELEVLQNLIAAKPDVNFANIVERYVEVYPNHGRTKHAIEQRAWRLQQKMKKANEQNDQRMIGNDVALAAAASLLPLPINGSEEATVNGDGDEKGKQGTEEQQKDAIVVDSIVRQRQREWDAMYFPRKALLDLFPVPWSITTWGDLKEFVYNDQNCINPEFREQIRRLQETVIRKQLQAQRQTGEEHKEMMDFESGSDSDDE